MLTQSCAPGGWCGSGTGAHLVDFADGIIAMQELLQVLQGVEALVSLYVGRAVRLSPQERAGRCKVYCAQVTLEQFSTRARRGGTAQGDQFPRTEQLIFEIVLVVHLGLPRPARPRPTKPTVLPVP